MLAPLTVESLQETFLREDCPHWWAYSAKNTKQKVGQFRKDEQEDEIMEDSWMQLEYLINSYPYGHLLIKCKKNPTDNEQSTHHWYVKWGEDLMPSRGYHSKRPAVGMGGGNMNMGMWPMMQFLMTQQSQFHASQLKQVQENSRLNFENQRLVDEINGTEEPNIQEYALKEGIDILKSWVGPKINPGQYQQSAPTAALGTAGQRAAEEKDIPTPPPANTGGMSFDAIVQDINVVYNALQKKYSRNEITRATAIFCQQNAEAADQFFGPLILQLRQHADQG